MAEIDLNDLADRVEKLEGPCRETDLAIVEAVKAGMRHPWFIAPPSFTASLDAAMKLVPKGWASVQVGRTDDGLSYAGVAGNDGHMMAEDPDEFYAGCDSAATPALALCCAALRGRLMEGEGDDG